MIKIHSKILTNTRQIYYDYLFIYLLRNQIIIQITLQVEYLSYICYSTIFIQSSNHFVSSVRMTRRQGGCIVRIK